MPDSRSGRAPHEPTPAPLRILLLEDDPAYARLVEEYLKDAPSLSHALRVVPTLARALEACERDRPDVVIADLGLPDAAGHQVVPALRKSAPRLPIVVLSGEDDLDTALESMKHGAQEFLVKGRSEDFFLARSIRAAIERKRLEEFEQLLVGVVSHDLRGPLQTLASVIDLMDKGLTAELLEFARIALSQVFALTSDLLDFTKLRIHGLLPIATHEADLAPCVESVVEGLRIARPGRAITLEVAGDTTGCFDSDRMSQVASNLIINAVKHSRSHSPVLVRCRGAEDALELEVQNRGEPIASDMLPKLFRPLERLDSRGRHTGSIGLGLYIAHQIVSAHGGSITVTSSFEQGTSFCVTLPRGRAPAGAGEGGE